MKTPTIYTFSDLHLFCGRAQPDTSMEKIHAVLDDADIMVLNGDIFDFRWSRHADHEATIQAALDWLEALVGKAPKCHFHYVLGNHDVVTEFMMVLDEFAARHNNLEWHEFTWQHEDVLFLHGDAIHRRMTHDEFLEYRSHWKNDKQKGKLVDRMYDAGSAVGLINLIHRVGFPERKSVGRMDAYLESSGLNKGVNKVYFGHTHVAIDGAELNGIQYYNCGAGMRGTPFNVLKVR